MKRSIKEIMEDLLDKYNKMSVEEYWEIYDKLPDLPPYDIDLDEETILEDNSITQTFRTKVIENIKHPHIHSVRIKPHFSKDLE